MQNRVDVNMTSAATLGPKSWNSCHKEWQLHFVPHCYICALPVYGEEKEEDIGYHVHHGNNILCARCVRIYVDLSPYEEDLITCTTCFSRRNRMETDPVCLICSTPCDACKIRSRKALGKLCNTCDGTIVMCHLCFNPFASASCPCAFSKIQRPK